MHFARQPGNVLKELHELRRLLRISVGGRFIPIRLTGLHQ